jgi:hypothetical protein
MSELQIIPYNDMAQMAKTITASGLFGFKTESEALALMLVAQAEGSHPVSAAKEYHIISGKPALKADAMLARFQCRGGKVRWIQLSETVAEAEFSHQSGGTITIKWTIEMAHNAEITKNPTWKKFPRAMLKARVISEGIRTVFPAVITGVYTPEEIQDMDYDSVPVHQQPANEYISSEEQAIIREYAIARGITTAKQFLDFTGYNSAKEIPSADFPRVRDLFEFNQGQE